MLLYVYELLVFTIFAYLSFHTKAGSVQFWLKTVGNKAMAVRVNQTVKLEKENNNLEDASLHRAEEICRNWLMILCGFSTTSNPFLISNLIN